MHRHRNAGGEAAWRRASTPPPTGTVQGLGVVDALRIELEPVQLPWLSAEIELLRYSLEDELTHQRVCYDELPQVAKEQRWRVAVEAEQELDRRAYQLEVIGMIAAQLPVNREAAATAVASPWDPPVGAAATQPDAVDRSVAIVGPASLMTALVRGATRNAARVLGEALHPPELHVDEHAPSGAAWRGPDLGHVTPALAARLRAVAAATETLTDTYLHVLAVRAYSFDPEYQPIRADELE